MGRGRRRAGRRVHLRDGVPPPKPSSATTSSCSATTTCPSRCPKRASTSSAARRSTSAGGMVMQNPNRPGSRHRSRRRATRACPLPDLTGEVPAACAPGARGADQPGDRGARRVRRARRGRGARSPTCASPAAARAVAWPRSRCSQGIEVAILDVVPEITEVVDVTDHASGANPYLRGRQEVGAIAIRPRRLRTPPLRERLAPLATDALQLSATDRRVRWPGRRGR